jgi:hypothetical protein
MSGQGKLRTGTFDTGSSHDENKEIRRVVGRIWGEELSKFPKSDKPTTI